MNKIGGDLLAVTGRSLADNAVAAFLSTDNREISSSSSDPRAWAIVPTPSLFPVGDDKLCVYCSTSVNVVEMPDVVGILLERDNVQVSPFQNLTVCKKLHSYPHRKKLRLILIASPTIRHLLRKALFFPTSIRLVIKQQ